MFTIGLKVKSRLLSLLHKASVIWPPGRATSRAKEEACKDCELCLPEGCSGMSLGERTGVTYKGRCTETSKNALSRIWRVEGGQPEPQFKSSAAEQTAMGQRHWARRGRGSSFTAPSVCPGTEESEAGDAPHSPVQPQTPADLQPCSPPSGEEDAGRMKNTLSHGSVHTRPALEQTWLFLFSFSFFCLSNYFSTFKTWRRFQKLSVPSYRLWLLIVPSLCFVRTLHIT